MIEFFLVHIDDVLSGNESLKMKCELSHSHGVVIAQSSSVELVLTRLVSGASHVDPAHRLKLQKAVLFAQLVKAAVYLVQDFEQPRARELAHHRVKVLEINEDDGHIRFKHWSELFGVALTAPDDAWDKKVED